MKDFHKKFNFLRIPFPILEMNIFRTFLKYHYTWENQIKKKNGKNYSSGIICSNKLSSVDITVIKSPPFA